MPDTNVIHAEDVLPVRSRVSWGAIFAGGAIALALHFLLTLLGTAIGLSVSDNVRAEDLGAGAAIWAVVSTLIALFVGGFVTSQCAVGENKMEAVAYGVIMWGVFFAIMLWLMASTVRFGFNAVLGLASATQVGEMSRADWEAAARRFGMTEDQIQDLRKRAGTEVDRARQAAQDPQTQQAALDATKRASWWAFGGTLLSMLAAAGGALVGAGPTLRLLPTTVTRTTVEAREVAGRY